MQSSRSLFSFMVLLLIVSFASRAGALQKTDNEDPVWIEASGEASGSEYDPPKEVMERAKNDAKRKAIEKAVGAFIRSHTLVSNSQLAEDLIYAQVSGRIDKIQDVQEERDSKNPNLYRVRLKALVRPVYPEEIEGIHIKLDLTKTNLTEGDEVKLHYQTNVDGYVYIFSIAADNSVTLLFPNSLLKDNSTKANVGQVFPPDNCPIRLQAMCLPGLKNRVSEEKIKIIATRHKEIILDRGFQEGIFQVYDTRTTGLVGDLARKLNQISPADWGESMIVYTVEPSGK